MTSIDLTNMPKSFQDTCITEKVFKTLVSQKKFSKHLYHRKSFQDTCITETGPALILVTSVRHK